MPRIKQHRRLRTEHARRRSLTPDEVMPVLREKHRQSVATGFLSTIQRPLLLSSLPVFREALIQALQLPEVMALAKLNPFDRARFRDFTYSLSGSPVREMLTRMSRQRRNLRTKRPDDMMMFDTLESGSRVGKTRAMVQMGLEVDAANDPQHPRHGDLAPGKFLIIDFHGAGDAYDPDADAAYTAEQILGMRLAARYLFR
ncbi:hypothetical protein WJX73_006277 [Symbiochloris irregularis]|uniref:Uncharacterized protein n=1 Tax=Symbiochloris irregularis TaxID=706552 RepID=A0AAW1PLW2_9CHLO